MVQAQSVTAEIDVLAMFFPIPTLGILPINSYVLRAQEPVLVDTGSPLDGMGADNTASFMAALREAIDPADLRWIWLTHGDMDHVGSVHHVLQEAPQARVVTSFLTVGRMTLHAPLPMDRVYLINPGQSLDVGDRTLTSVRPPFFDAPDTAGLFDSKSRTFFSSDFFGGLMSEPADTAADIPTDEREQGQRLWPTVDAPWIHGVDRGVFRERLEQVRALQPEWILSTHLPPAHGMLEEFLELLATVPDAEPFVGPDQKTLEAMLARA